MEGSEGREDLGGLGGIIGRGIRVVGLVVGENLVDKVGDGGRHGLSLEGIREGKEVDEMGMRMRRARMDGRGKKRAVPLGGAGQERGHRTRQRRRRSWHPRWLGSEGRRGGPCKR